MIMKHSRQLTILLLAIALLKGVQGVANPIYGNSYTCSSTNPGQPCTAYCSYSITTTHTLT